MPVSTTPDDLLEQIETLKEQLEAEQHENAMLRRILFSQYARQPRPMQPLDLPLSQRAVLLFEVMPDAFDLESLIVTAEKLGLTESEAAEHVRTYFQEGMLSDDESGQGFVKTGHRPYLQD